MPRRRQPTLDDSIFGQDGDEEQPEASPKPKPGRVPGKAALHKAAASVVALGNLGVTLASGLFRLPYAEPLSEAEAKVLATGLTEAGTVNASLARALQLANRAGGYAALVGAALVIVVPRVEHWAADQGKVQRGAFADLYRDTYEMRDPLPPSAWDRETPQEAAEAEAYVNGSVPYNYVRPVADVFPTGS